MNPLVVSLESLLIAKREAQNAVDLIEEKEKELRDEIRLQMIESVAQGGEKTIHGNDYTFSLSTRKDIKVADEAAVRTDLQSKGLLEDCLRLDLVKVKGLAKVQNIMGMEEVESDILSIREKKGDVEKVVPEESVSGFHKRMRERGDE